MTLATPGVGYFSAVVWPTYVGCATDDPGSGLMPLNEPFGDINYNRGQIWWTPQPNGDVLGSAQVFVPAGVYIYLVFCHGPIRDMMMLGDSGKRRLEQPLVYDRPGIVDVEPIRNTDYLPRAAALPRLNGL